MKRIISYKEERGRRNEAEERLIGETTVRRRWTRNSSEREGGGWRGSTQRRRIRKGRRGEGE